MLTLRLTLTEAINGNWDGGKKSIFAWNIDRLHSNNEQTAVGSWEANYFFSVKAGRTERQTLGYARQVLKARLKRNRLYGTFEYIKGE